MVVMDPVVKFIKAKHIDSFQKLIFLLFLYQHPGIQGTSQEFGTRLYLGNTGLSEKIFAELQQAGLVDQIENGFKLHDGADIDPDLRRLAQAFEDPLARQQLLNQVSHH
jgi:hypothetical protein